jgi:hypothetical protein
MRLTDEQISAELRALRATPDQTFAATLDRRVTAGFPKAKPARNDRELTWGRLLPVFGVLATVAVIAVVASNLGGGGGGSDSGLLSKSRPASPELAAPINGQSARSQREIQGAPPAVAGNSTFPAAPPSAPESGSRPRNGRPQIQELSAALGLSTDSDELQGAADGVVDITGQYHGFVDSSDVHVGGSNGHAFFQLRIPAAHVRDALDDLSGLGRVVSRDEGSANVTGAYVDSGKAYRQARAKVDSLLAQLRTASTAEVASIRQQLVIARQQLVAARKALRGIKQGVAYAPVTIQIRADGDGSWSLGDAAGDAGDVLKAIAGGTLVTLAVLVPLAALLAFMWFGAGVFSRRRREATLDRS